MDSKAAKIKRFDPNAPATRDAGIFGLPFTPAEADIIIYPVPWEVTVSYTAGTAAGPEAVFNASHQVDLYDPYYPDGWQHGIAMLPVPSTIKDKSARLRKKAGRIIQALEKGSLSERLKTTQKEINKAGTLLTDKVKKETLEWLDKGKMILLLGGDHSTPLGYLKALTTRHPSFGILQIDAHMDLRKSFEGFRYSHASIMYNALQLNQVSKLVQVGIRDYCQEEVDYVKASKGRVRVFYDRDLKVAKYKGKNWAQLCEEIISELPEKVYISFDIDGLDPKLCPSTGTPVAGGFEAEEVLYLFRKLVDSGRKIIGVDLNEISPGKDEWDANVGARILFRLCNLMSRSRPTPSRLR